MGSQTHVHTMMAICNAYYYTFCSLVYSKLMNFRSYLNTFQILFIRYRSLSLQFWFIIFSVSNSKSTRLMRWASKIYWHLMNQRINILMPSILTLEKRMIPLAISAGVNKNVWIDAEKKSRIKLHKMKYFMLCKLHTKLKKSALIRQKHCTQSLHHVTLLT